MIDNKNMLIYIILALVFLGLFTLINLLPPPYNPFWHLFSGYYRYDPRQEASRPPTGLVLDRPETALKSYLDAMLVACGSYYPPGVTYPVQSYEVEMVEFLGKTNFREAERALSLVHTRLFYTNGSTQLVIFQLEATRNRGVVWYLGFGSAMGAGGWRILDEVPAAPYESVSGCSSGSRSHPQTPMSAHSRDTNRHQKDLIGYPL